MKNDEKGLKARIFDFFRFDQNLIVQFFQGAKVGIGPEI
jgi:hypothetical protein